MAGTAPNFVALNDDANFAKNFKEARFFFLYVSEGNDDQPFVAHEKKPDYDINLYLYSVSDRIFLERGRVITLSSH